MHRVEIRPLEEFLDETPVPPRPFSATFEEYRFKTWVLLHTSGSTGNPKIVHIKHGLVSAVDTYRMLQHPTRFVNDRIFVPFPPFHLAGLNYGLPIALWYDATVVLPPVGAPLSAELCHTVHLHGQARHSMLTPSLISELAKNDTWRAQLGHLKSLTYSGGPLSDDVADQLSELTQLTSSLGATEYGGIPQLPKKDGNWQYFKFDTESAGLEFRETEQPGLYEMVFVRGSNEITNLVQAIFVTFPDLDEYHTKDLFSRHPAEPGLWKYEARLDDVIVLSNGEKLNPVQMEGLITTCPAVKGCLVVGQGQFQTALLIERQEPSMSFEDCIRQVQPYIDRANKLCPSHGRIAGDKLIFTTPEKPLPRAAKGTIQRARAVAVYREEIQASYAEQVPNNKTTVSGPHLVLDDMSSAEKSIQMYLCHHLELEPSQLQSSDDFFSMGMDSLQVINLVREINTSRGKGSREINAMFVYDHPTVEQLALALTTGVRVREYSDLSEDDEVDKRTWQSMDDLFQELRPASDGNGKRQGFASLLRSKKSPPIYQPDGGMVAWQQVLGSFLINVSNWGLVNSFGVYQAYYETNLLAGSSPSAISWIGTVQGTLLLVVGVVSGPLFDKGYFRTTTILAGIGLVLGMMMLSISTRYYQIMLSQGILVGICSGFLYIPSIALIPLYFKSRRGLAIGLATAGGSVGGVVYPIIFRRLLNDVGFGWATRVIAFISLLTLTVAVLLLKPIGSRSSRQLFDASALVELPYLSFLIAGFLLFAGVLVPYFLVSTYALVDLELSEDLSFYVLAIMNGAQFFGRIIPAILADWLGPELILLGAEVFAAVLGFSWIAVNQVGGYIVWLVAFGFVSGVIVTLPPTVLPYICPNLAVFGTRLGMLYAVAGVGFLISSPVALALNNVSNGFLGSQCWIGACCLVAVVFYSMTAREAWKRRRLYEDNGRNKAPYLLRRPRDRHVDEEKGHK